MLALSTQPILWVHSVPSDIAWFLGVPCGAQQTRIESASLNCHLGCMYVHAGLINGAAIFILCRGLGMRMYYCSNL